MLQPDRLEAGGGGEGEEKGARSKLQVLTYPKSSFTTLGGGSSFFFRTKGTPVRGVRLLGEPVKRLRKEAKSH